jgi:hypothetical protein
MCLLDLWRARPSARVLAWSEIELLCYCVWIYYWVYQMTFKSEISAHDAGSWVMRIVYPGVGSNLMACTHFFWLKASCSSLFCWGDFRLNPCAWSATAAWSYCRSCWPPAGVNSFWKCFGRVPGYSSSIWWYHCAQKCLGFEPGLGGCEGFANFGSCWLLVR